MWYSPRNSFAQLKKKKLNFVTIVWVQKHFLGAKGDLWLWNSAFYLHGKSKSLQAEKNKFPFGKFTGPWVLLPYNLKCFLTIYALIM